MNSVQSPAADWSMIVEHAFDDPAMWQAARAALATSLYSFRRYHGWVEDYDSVINVALATALAAKPATAQEAAAMIRREVRRHQSAELARRKATAVLHDHDNADGGHERVVVSQVTLDAVLRLVDSDVARWCRAVVDGDPVWVTDRVTGRRVKRGRLGHSPTKIKELLAS
ncbi:MAG: hypothetical protein ABMA25_02485 [Ilumatobacteraceae bacterium]